ncbi:sulfotransferase family 2 domain-containing protein [Salinisphaera orenii]|uniref:sulfotransferase family 2 domain-containing protein n=1 Tax=Salinisphaera orenii TaxID=856731 RepID=UPI000F496BE8|nr:sulfotransferase family 2 domain-containing protein [Salinisphaera halophila]
MWVGSLFRHHISRAKRIAQNKPPYDGNFWVSEKHKLIYLSIPKNANSYFKSLFLYNHPVAFDYVPELETANEYLSRTAKKGELTATSATILRDKGYTKFVILRDPLARLVSAYLDKVVNSARMSRHDERRGKAYHSDGFFNEISQTLGVKVDRDTLSFSQLLRYLEKTSPFLVDKHYRAQWIFLNRIPFDYYGTMENIPDVLDFLKSRGLRTHSFTARSPKRTPYTKPLPSGSNRNIADMPASDLRLCDRYPPAQEFFKQPATLERAAKLYKSDISIFLKVQALDKEAYFKRYR